MLIGSYTVVDDKLDKLRNDNFKLLRYCINKNNNCDSLSYNLNTIVNLSKKNKNKIQAKLQDRLTLSNKLSLDGKIDNKHSDLVKRGEL